MTHYDLAIIGAGPAGMAATIEAVQAGLSVILLDEQARVGGQIYRNIERTTDSLSKILGKDYVAGRPLVATLAKLDFTYVTNASVWQADNEGRISYSVDGAANRISAERILIATGALERPVPIPGWTLPGVMMAGAGQILLKQSGIVGQGPVVVGSGPLIYLIAAQMVRAGTPPVAIIETQTSADLIKAQKHLLGALVGWRYLVKGLGLLWELKRAGVKRYTGARDLTVEGQNHAEALKFSHRGQSVRLVCDTVFVHMGVVPNTQLSRAMRLDHEWDKRQQCFRPVTDSWGQSSSRRIYVAGDGGGISGAKYAEISGRIAAVKIANDLGALSDGERDLKGRSLRFAAGLEQAARPFIDTAYPPLGQVLTPDDDTIVCRCEEITAGDIRRYATMGCEGPNQTKAFGRAGMGPCQGRYCGLTVSALLSQANKRSMDEVGYYRIRPPIKPLTLGELAQLDDRDESEDEGMDLG